MAAPLGDESTDAIVGPSHRLPWPFDVVARRAWDEASLSYRRYRHVLPAPVTQRIAAAVELSQRPALALWRATAGDTRLLVGANDPLFRDSLLRALGMSAAARTGSIGRTQVRPDARFDADLVALEIPTLAARDFARAGWLVLPRWVAMEVNLGQAEHVLWDASKRETIRRIERSNLELEVIRGRDAAREFHGRMHVPTARIRHGPLAIVVRPAYVEAAVRCGFLLFARSGGERRAGLLVVTRPGRTRVLDALMFGVGEGNYADSELAREAVYLFAMRWARDVFGASRLGLTAAAPFVHDGILRYKKRWGADARADLRQANCVAMRFESGSRELCRALGEQPLIVLRGLDGNPSLVAFLPRLLGEPPGRTPRTPGVDVMELELQSAADLPGRVDAWAKGA